MADEAQDSAVVEDSQSTPDTQGDSESGAPATEAPDSPDYQQRYESQQGALTQAQQEAAEYRRIVEGARQGDPQALELLGIELQDEEGLEDDEYVDPTEQKLTQIEEYLTGQQREAEARQLQEAETQWIGDQLKAAEKEAGLELSEQQVRFVTGAALADRGEDGAPNVAGAFKDFQAALEADREAYLKSKKAPKAPVGGPGEEKIDLSNDDDRKAAMARIMEVEGSE